MGDCRTSKVRRRRLSLIGALRENIADKAIWIAKKHYIMQVWDSEGTRYTQPKLKIMGIDMVKSSTPQYGRKVFGKEINENPEAVYTKEILDLVDEAAKKEFSYGNQ